MSEAAPAFRREPRSVRSLALSQEQASYLTRAPRFPGIFAGRTPRQEPQPGDPQPGVDAAFYDKEVLPVLKANCYKCHVEKTRGGLSLASRSGLLKGGDSGPAVVPGKPAESLLLAAVGYTREDLQMPPKGKLPDAVIADLEKWVRLGAPDPRDKAAGGAMTLEAARGHWAYRPIRKPAWRGRSSKSASDCSARRRRNSCGDC